MEQGGGTWCSPQPPHPRFFSASQLLGHPQITCIFWEAQGVELRPAELQPIKASRKTHLCKIRKGRSLLLTHPAAEAPGAPEASCSTSHPAEHFPPLL